MPNLPTSLPCYLPTCMSFPSASIFNMSSLEGGYILLQHPRGVNGLPFYRYLPTSLPFYLSTMLPPYLHVVPLRVYFQYVQLGDPLLCQKIVDTDDDKVGR